MHEMHRGKVYISYELLAHLLQLPEGTEILYLENAPEDMIQRRFAMHVSHPDLPRVIEGGTPPEIDGPVITSQWDWK